MWPHFIHLLHRSWDNMVRATGTTTLGFIVWTVAVAAVGWAATVAARWIELKRAKDAFPMRKALRGSFWSGAFIVCGISLLVLVSLGSFVVLTTYDDHESLVKDIKTLRCRNRELESILEKKTHGLDTTDPAFSNMLQVLQVFTSFRRSLGATDIPCQIKVTAPQDSGQIAGTVTALASIASNCNTYGPMDSRMDPDVERDTMRGMVPGIIVFHAAKDFTAANQLFTNFSNIIQLKRSYVVPSGSPKNFIWLQFGTNTKWNSQLR